MSDGLSTKAVAHQLGIAVKTVESHKTRIFGKLGVRTQAQAVALAIGNDDDATTGLDRRDEPRSPTSAETRSRRSGQRHRGQGV